MKKTTFKPSNFHKLTPKFWKRIGNCCNYAIPALMPVIAMYPIDPMIKVWTTSILSTVLVLIKFATKLFAEEEN